MNEWMNHHSSVHEYNINIGFNYAMYVYKLEGEKKSWGPLEGYKWTQTTQKLHTNIHTPHVNYTPLFWNTKYIVLW